MAKLKSTTVVGDLDVSGKITGSIASATTTTNGLMTSSDKVKLNGIAVGANNYIHPNDANIRHVTDIEKSVWNGTKEELDNLKEQVAGNKPIVITDDTPVGTIVFRDSSASLQDGWLRCDGKSLSKEEYSELFAVIGYKHGGIGDQFLLPNLVIENLVIEGIDDEETTMDAKIVKDQIGIIKAKKLGEDMTTVAQEVEIAKNGHNSLKDSIDSKASQAELDAIKEQVSQNRPIIISNDTPIGVIAYRDSSGAIPSGWLACNGDTISKEKYEELFSLIGYKHGGEGSNFKLPYIATGDAVFTVDNGAEQILNIVKGQVAIIKASNLTPDILSVGQEVDLVKGDHPSLDAALKSTYADKKEFENIKDQVSQNKPIVISNDSPIGTIAYAAKTASVAGDWLICDGARLTKTDYSELFAVIGYAHGGSGEYFNLPTIDLLGSAVISGVNADLTQKKDNAVKDTVAIIKVRDRAKDMTTVAQEWTSFKENGGEIGGDIKVPSLSTFKNDMAFRIREANGVDNKISMFLEAKDTGERMLYVAQNNVDLGVSSRPWKDIYLSGFSKSSNGYTKLPNGMILQWGKLETTFNNGYVDHKMTFTKEFPNSVCSVHVTCMALGNAYERDVITNPYWISKTGFTLSAKHTVEQGNWATQFTYIAIGY